MLLCGHIADGDDPYEEEPLEEVGDTSDYPNPENPWDWDSLQMYEPLDSLDKRS